MVGISLSRVRYILKNMLNVRKISVRWVPHLLTYGQNKQRVEIKFTAPSHGFHNCPKLSRVHYILKNMLNVRKISARLVPDLLTDGQNKQRVERNLKTKCYQIRRLVTGFIHVALTHDNALAHTSAIVTILLQKMKVTVLPHISLFT